MYRNSNIPGLKIFFLLIIFYTSVYSQSDNYWSWNFNTSSVLLGGSVIAGSASSSAVFYNPALINSDMPSLSISASLLSIQSFKIENAAGTGIDIDKLLVKIQPRFISKLFDIKKERISLELAVLSPVSESMNFTIQHLDELDIINRTKGIETYSGYIKYERDYNDFFIGAGGSYKLNENLSLGFSTFASVKTMKYNYQQSVSAFQETDSVTVGNIVEASYIAQENFNEDLKYWDLDLIFKLGVQYRSKSEKLNLGLNITFPNLPIYGEGDIRIQSERSNVFDNQSNQFTSNKNTIETEEKVRVNVKSPFSISLGIQYFVNSHNDFISLTGEYFHSLDPYNLFSSERNDTLGNQLLDNDFFQPYEIQANSVINWAIGFKKFLSPNLNILLGFRTDFTSKPNDETVELDYKNHNLGKINFDKYHFSFGPTIKIKKFYLITGLQYTRGREKNISQLINFTNPQEYISSLDVSLQGIRENNAIMKLNEIALFFGINF